MKLSTVISAAILSTASAYTFVVPKNILANAAKTTQATAVAGVLATGLAAPAFAGDFTAGESIFNANCAVCHVGGQNVIMPEKTLEKEALDQYLAGGRKESSVVTQVTNGKNAMPAFGKRLSDEDIANVATYVISTSESGWDDDE